MKLTETTILAAFFASMIGTVSLAETVIIDGCEAFKVEGANYYNFTDPRCVTGQKLHTASSGEDARVERIAAEKAAKEAAAAANSN